jgi:hypothetical protein
VFLSFSVASLSIATDSDEEDKSEQQQPHYETLSVLSEASDGDRILIDKLEDDSKESIKDNTNTLLSFDASDIFVPTSHRPTDPLENSADEDY